MAGLMESFIMKDTELTCHRYFPSQRPEMQKTLAWHDVLMIEKNPSYNCILFRNFLLLKETITFNCSHYGYDKIYVLHVRDTIPTVRHDDQFLFGSPGFWDPRQLYTMTICHEKTQTPVYLADNGIGDFHCTVYIWTGLPSFAVLYTVPVFSNMICYRHKKYIVFISNT